VVVTIAASGILILTLWLLSGSGVQLFVFAGAYGFLASAFTSLAPALVAQISVTGQMGTRIGIQSAVMSVAILLGSPIGGQLLELASFARVTSIYCIVNGGAQTSLALEVGG
jgi:hypothetical protein